MCGLAGFWWAKGRVSDSRAELEKMAHALQHRGPDDRGIWFAAEAGIGFAHRRLAVVDLSSAGHQPMHSVSGQYVIAYNGEIYNHLQLRHQLEEGGFVQEWRGHSDTETLLAAIEAWGLKTALQRAAGMFAMSLWCRKTRTLMLARDRLGEKPMFYGWQKSAGGKIFLFGSELKALKAHCAFSGQIDREALALFMRHSSVPAPHCIYAGFGKLLPGHILTLGETEECVVEPYWDAPETIVSGVLHPLSQTDDELVTNLEELLFDAVGQQMEADVPLGSFLSGGVDSSTVVAIMQAISAKPVRTYTIGFERSEYDEARHAKAVAAHLGTEHTELYVTANDAIALVPKLSQIYDEPFGDSSQIPTIMVSQLARRDVTVALSGDGGDELFGGYNRYMFTAQVWPTISKFPLWVRNLGAGALSSIPPSLWAPIGAGRAPDFANKIMKVAQSMRARTFEDLYDELISQWSRAVNPVIGAGGVETSATSASRWSGLSNTERMMACDMLDYLPNDVLTKLDRASMSVSLETRVPLLDHRVVEFAWRIPLHQKLRKEGTKWPLRQVLYRHVPQALIERPKVGFGVPLDEWLRGPLRSWAEGLLDEARLKMEGYLDATMVRQTWQSHLNGHANAGHALWNVLMFQQWLEHQGLDDTRT